MKLQKVMNRKIKDKKTEKLERRKKLLQKI